MQYARHALLSSRAQHEDTIDVDNIRRRIRHYLLYERRWCSGIMQDSHSCDPGSIPGRRTSFLILIKLLVILP